MKPNLHVNGVVSASYDDYNEVLTLNLGSGVSLTITDDALIAMQRVLPALDERD